MNYYKITSESENHHGLQYHDGVVTDPLPFNPSGSCLPGGLYFAREDILAFLGYGPWIRKVEPIGEIYEDSYKKVSKFKAHALNCEERREVTVDIIKELISEGADARYLNNDELTNAVALGNMRLVKLLLPFVNPKEHNSEALRYSVLNGRTELVKILLPVSDPTAYENQCLIDAARLGHYEIVKLLIPVCDPKSHKSEALYNAAVYGHNKIIELLIPVSDVKIDRSKALRNATMHGHIKCVELLAPFSDIEESRALYLAGKYGHKEIVKILEKHLGTKHELL